MILIARLIEIFVMSKSVPTKAIFNQQRKKMFALTDWCHIKCSRNILGILVTMYSIF